jgi:hypothetical protein
MTGTFQLITSESPSSSVRAAHRHEGMSHVMIEASDRKECTLAAMHAYSEASLLHEKQAG